MSLNLPVLLLQGPAQLSSSQHQSSCLFLKQNYVPSPHALYSSWLHLMGGGAQFPSHVHRTPSPSKRTLQGQRSLSNFTSRTNGVPSMEQVIKNVDWIKLNWLWQTWHKSHSALQLYEGVNFKSEKNETQGYTLNLHSFKTSMSFRFVSINFTYLLSHSFNTLNYPTLIILKLHNIHIYFQSVFFLA